MTPARKRCRRCGRTKPAAAFPLNAKMRDGLHSWCRQCFVDRTRQWQRDHDDELNRRRRARRRTDAAWRTRENARRRELYRARRAQPAKVGS